MRATLILLTAILAGALEASGCAPRSYTQQGKDADQMVKDEQLCRNQVTAQAQRQRNIDDQRRAVFEGERERFGQQGLYSTMDNQGYQNNVDRLMSRCMQARGWQPKQQNTLASWWNRNTTFNTPLGK